MPNTPAAATAVAFDSAAEVADWIAARRGFGRVLSLGGIPWSGLSPSDADVLVVTELADHLEYADLFDEVWLPNSLADGRFKIGDLLARAHTALYEGGTLLCSVPFGLSPARSSRAFYVESVRGLLQSLFDVVDLAVIDDHIVAKAERRSVAEVEARHAHNPAEQAFLRHEGLWAHRIQELDADLKNAGLRYRGMTQRADQALARAVAAERDLTRLRRQVDRVKPFLKVPLAIIRRVRRMRSGPASAPARAGTPAETTSASTTSPASAPVTAPANWRETLNAEFAAWLDAARSAPGEEVVVMFSGTTFIQEHRANRPIRLTRVYLDRKCPVFFNYYRWRDTEPLPEHPDPLVFQSPIDVTPSLLDAVLTADYGGKKKTFYASFPHETMVRFIAVAAQHGWVTIYDARDDWEEFHKVGMAKWYHPGYERYVAAEADIATAVSRPLARKISSLAGNRTVQVNANGLDPQFPKPSGPRTPGNKTVIGYFGHLTDKWFDWPLVVAAAQRYPEYVFELAGHGAPKLDLPPNVKLIGMLGHEELAERSRGWTAAIIPFKNSPLADAVDPIKIYEYLHLRLPTLTSYFPQCRDYPGTWITEGSPEFLDRLADVGGMVLSDSELDGWLAENTWQVRVDAYRRLGDEVRAAGRTGARAMLGGAT